MSFLSIESWLNRAFQNFPHSESLADKKGKRNGWLDPIRIYTLVLPNRIDCSHEIFSTFFLFILLLMRFMINIEILLTKLYKPYKTQLGESGCRSCRTGALALFFNHYCFCSFFYVVHVLLQYCASLLLFRKALLVVFVIWSLDVSTQSHQLIKEYFSEY